MRGLGQQWARDPATETQPGVRAYYRMSRDQGYYLEQAQKCREAAEQATSAAAKAHWREAERCWLALANLDPESAWRRHCQEANKPN